MRTLALILLTVSVWAQTSGPSQPASDHYRFPSGAGLLFFYVKPDKVTQFEAVALRIAEVLQKSEDPVRKQQALSWHMFQSQEPQSGAVIYVVSLDPAVPTADYEPIKILGEALPAEVQSLYTQLTEATIKVERMRLKRLTH